MIRLALKFTPDDCSSPDSTYIFRPPPKKNWIPVGVCVQIRQGTFSVLFGIQYVRVSSLYCSVVLCDMYSHGWRCKKLKWPKTILRLWPMIHGQQVTGSWAPADAMRIYASCRCLKDRVPFEQKAAIQLSGILTRLNRSPGLKTVTHAFGITFHEPTNKNNHSSMCAICNSLFLCYT